MPQCCPYLFFNGNAEQAMRTYERVLGGKLELLRYSDAPPTPAGGEPPPGCEPSDMTRVMHACLTFEGGFIMCSDAPNPQMAETMQGMSVSLTFDSAEQARRVFDALADGGEVRMPFGPTFWADGFGMLLDRFGTPWMLGGGMREVPPQG
jgi:PhnB protein